MKATIFLSGSQIYLRPLRREDLNDNYLYWLNAPEITRYLESGTFPTTYEELEHFYEGIIGSSNQVLLAIIDRGSDKHLGNVKLGPINWVHRNTVFGILIGDENFWGKGIATECTNLVVEYAFNTLNLNRVELGVYAEHLSAIRVYEKMGFQIEGRSRESLFHEGMYKDRISMGLLKSDYNRQVEAMKVEAEDGVR